MFVLCSNGLSGEKLLASVREKSAGGKKAALVVTADNEYKEKNYHVPRCTFEQFEEKCRTYEETRNTKVIRINDGDGVMIEGDEIIVCRENI